MIRFAATTGWRIASEVLPLEWRQVDFAAGEVTLDPGTTKNGEARKFHLTDDLRTVLDGQSAEHDRLKKAEHICPYVFFREVAEKRGGAKKPKRIISFNKAWKAACRAAGCPGKIPHDLRRTAMPRNGPQRDPRACRDAAVRPQDRVRLSTLQHHVRWRPQGSRGEAEHTAEGGMIPASTMKVWIHDMVLRDTREPPPDLTEEERAVWLELRRILTRPTPRATWLIFRSTCEATMTV